MAVDLESKATKDLETIVANCVRLERTTAPISADANRILEARRTGEYNLEKTIAMIRQSGRLGSFLCFKDIADASGLNWARSRRRIFPHLDEVYRYTINKGWPNLTAIIVNKENIETGEMTADNLKGFLRAIQALGWDIDLEDVAFVKREQQRVFAWCREEY
jgi:hypothetical protein